MKDIVLDFESYYDREYSLGDLTTREYIMDPRFEVHLLSVAEGGDKPFVLEPREIPDFIHDTDWSKVRLCCHNTMFDAAILAWVYGAHPAFLECTMHMARATVAHTLGGASLARLNEASGRVKDKQALMNMKGRRYHTIDRDSEEWQRFRAYAGDDADDCRFHRDRFRKALPGKQLVLIDTVLRMFVYGRLKLNREKLLENQERARLERERVFANAGVKSASDIRSREKFAELLRENGVEPPQKISDRTGKLTFAFSKKDPDFLALQGHHDEKIRTLVEAKLNASSSLEETRTERFLRLEQVGDGTLNVPLLVSGAHTHRFSGSDGINLQNLPRNSGLRYAIEAPKGHKIVVVDASQIEARVLAWLAGCKTLVDAFAAGKDVYSLFASRVFGFEVNKAEHPEERFLGKTCILGLGYMTGWRKLLLTLLIAGQQRDEDFCKTAVRTYRTDYEEIPQLWSTFDHMIQVMAQGGRANFGPIEFNSQRWKGPAGLYTVYPKLRFGEQFDHDGQLERSGYEFWNAKEGFWKNLYGGALTENIVQHLSFLQIVDTMIKMRQTSKSWKCVLQVHDELAYVVPEDEAEDAYGHCMKFMCEQPSWATFRPYQIPLAAEGAIADNYGEAK